VLRGLAPADAGEHRRNSTAKIQDRLSTLRIGAPLDKAIDIGAIVAKVQLDPSAIGRSKASPMARHAGSRKFTFTGARVLLSADTAEQRTPDFHCRAAGDLRAGTGAMTSALPPRR